MRDFDELVQALRGWEADFRQLSRGPFHGEFQVIQFPSLQIVRIKANRVIQARGRSKPNGYGFSLVTRGNQAAIWRGRRLRPGTINVNGPGSVMDHLSSAPYESILLMIDAEVLHKKVQLFDGTTLEERFGPKQFVPAAAAAFQTLEATVRRALAGTRRDASSMSQPADCLDLQQACIRHLLQALASTDPANGMAVDLNHRRAIVRQAEEFMLANLDQRLTDEDVCQELHVSERTLRYAFQDLLGLGPMAYFKAKKLNAVRYALKVADPAKPPIHDIARRWGFHHTGNFAADYRRLFGELPSQTFTK